LDGSSRGRDQPAPAAEPAVVVEIREHGREAASIPGKRTDWKSSGPSARSKRPIRRRRDRHDEEGNGAAEKGTARRRKAPPRW
jgi:hypothetical protein